MKYSRITISGKICTGKTTLFWNLQKQDEKITKEIDYRVRDLLKQEKNISMDYMLQKF